MAKSLSDLRAEKRDNRETHPYTACLARDLVAEVQTLTTELGEVDAQIEERPKPDGEGAPPARMGQGESQESKAARKRAGEIRERLAELLDLMADYEGELIVRANRDEGEWRRWANAHPARDEDTPGHFRDLEVTGGYCNADDLIDDLATYAYTWNGERLADGDWDVLNIAPPDKKQIAKIVVGMYESVAFSAPKWRSALRANLPRSSDFDLPAPSASPSDDSSAGSPKNDTSTTTPTGT